MIEFVAVCVVMLLVAFALLAKPLLKNIAQETRARRVSVWLLTSLSMAALVSVMYVNNTNWSWRAEATANADSDRDAVIAALVAKTQAAPSDISAWLALGKAYVGAEKFIPASNAYQHAYDLSHAQNIDAITGLAEALVLSDQSSLNSRVGMLIEQALQLQPKNPKALFYGGMVALQLNNLPLARERFKSMLALNPPAQVRSLLERQIQDLNEQLGDAPATAATASTRKIKVKVNVAADIKRQLSQPIALFVLARNPRQPGAPLAVQRHLSNELPLQVELTAADAMLPTRTLADTQEVEVVARLSASGTPTEQSGDYYGRAAYSFAKGEQGSVTIQINQRVK